MLQRPRLPLWAVPASSRPSRLLPTLHLTVAFVLLFDLGILTTFTLVLLTLPFAYFPPTRLAFLATGKATFVRVSTLMVQWFSPTELVISAGDGIDAAKLVERAQDGRVRKVNLPTKGVWISNHTTLADWIYLWDFAYLTEHASAIYIALKSSLRKIPIIGWAASWFGFIFLERRWASDRTPFRQQLSRIAKETNRGGQEQKLALLIFPEGTIVTANTRGISSKFAEKTAVSDYKHVLLPRSTGLFFALRQLAPAIPKLELVDLTVGYPLPRQPPPADGKPVSPLYASDYYTLPSILLSHVPPPELHIHVRAFPVSSIPLGDMSTMEQNPNDEGSEEEKRVFEEWLRKRWQEKDDLMERFRTEGTFLEQRRSKGTIETFEEDDDDERRPGEHVWPIRLRHPLEPLLAFSLFLPLLALYGIWRGRWVAAGLLLSGTKYAFGRRRGKVAASREACGCGKLAVKTEL
ncbi:lysocardiolipin and lysophospholipid acyltransferase [Rhodotorula toruloides]|uniref:Lysocardiolipin and lysophospholipid acyltransferase n=1 Tax=Rhodotorula toruloides TaxID=5286 RepID=A0A511KK77_RHOTO|nr:lysocardiolipin and lysophospholipid acyltransferase [Rhodotorula toruloides]